ncbi:MAG: DUF58 domain-containing protein [Bdellovibrionales bacterium]|nr:DUF58 domain-containing protein [Bdellovibrionales bacterium]
MSAPSSVLKKVKLIELKLRQRVRDLFAGGYRSAFKGQGMIFSDYRQYVPGDDIRAISWPLTARMGEPYIKIFEEERGATFMLVMDVSGSFDFGTRGFKGEVACELASLIAMSAQRNQDAVGLLLFSDRVEHYVPPARGSNHVLRIVRDLYSFKRTSLNTDILPALDFMNGVLKKHCHIFLFSDFFSFSPFVRQLKITNQRHDVVAGIVQDPFESHFPALGLLEVEDAETGQRRVVDTSSGVFTEEYKNRMEDKKKEVISHLRKSGVDHFFIDTDQDIFKQLMVFIKKRRDK